MANFGDTINIDNTNPFNALTEFKNSILDPLYLQLTGQRKELVMRVLCAWNDLEGKGTSRYLTKHEIDINPLLYIPVRDDRGNQITRADWENITDKDAVRLTNDAGANYIIHELTKFFNDKVILGNISKDECVDIAGDAIDRTFSYIIFYEDKYAVTDTTQLITSADNLMESLYVYLTTIADGKFREAVIQVLTGGGIQVRKDETPVQQSFGEKLKNNRG